MYNTDIAVSLFGGSESIQNRSTLDSVFRLWIDYQESSGKEFPYEVALDFTPPNKELQVKGASEDHIRAWAPNSEWQHPEFQQFHERFSRLFVKNERLVKLPLDDNRRLSLSAKNLEKVLKRILINSILRAEIFEWLELFVPSFKAVEIDDRDELHWFEQSSSAYFTKDLISDGTYNILALLTAVYQSDDKPQFLCIEEPENGLHPQVARELVDFFRIMCEERGHYIWLNTHSQSMVSRVRPEELVIVEKKDGATQVKQFNKEDFYGMRVDDAWLTNSLGGGLAW